MKTRPVTSSVKKRPRPTKKAKSFKGKSKGSCGKLGTFTEPHLLPRALSKEYPVPKLSKTVIVSSKKNKVTTEKDKNILTSTPHYTKTRSDVFFNSADSSFFSPIDSVSKKKDEIKEQKATPVGSSKKNNDSVHREISFLKPKPPTTVISEKQNSSEKERSPEKKTGKEKSKRPHLAKKSKLVKTASQDKDRADHVVPDISSLTSPVSLENIKKPRGRPHLKPATSESTNVNDNNNKAHYDNLVVLISSQELTESPRKDTIDFVNKTPRRRASRGLPNQCNMCVDENLHEEEGIKSRLSPVPGVSESVSTPKKSRVKNRSENPVPAENSSGHAESPPGVYKNLTEETTAKMSPRVEAVNKGNNKAHTAAANDEGTGRSTMPEKSRVQDNSPHETSSQNNVGEIMSRSPVREAENQENNEAQQAAVINKDVPESVGTPQKPTVPAENSSGCPESPPRNYNNLMEEISARKVSAVKAASKGNNKAQIGVVPNNDVPESVGTPQKPTLKSRSENPVPVENSSGCPDSPPRNYNNLMEEIAARKASTVEAASKGNNKAQIGAVPNNEEPGCSTTSQRSRVLGPRKPSAKRVAEEPGSSTTSPRSRVQGPRKTPAKRAAGTKEDLFSMLYSKEELAKRKEKWENLFAEFERRHREHEEERAADFDRLSTTSSRSDWSWTSSELARKPKKPVPVVNKTRAERVESLHKVIEKIRRRTVNKEIQTSNVFSQNSASSRAPLYRRSSLIKAVQRSLAQGLTDRTDGLGEPNIFDSIQQDLDIFGFSAIELDISSLNRPWRFENGGEQSDNFTPSFIRPEAEIRYSDICNRSRVGDGESGENSPNKTLTQNDASPAISTASFNRLTRSNFRKQYVKKNRGLVDQDVSAPSRTKQKNVQEANVKLPIVDTSNIETSKDEEADINPPEPPRGNSNKNKSLDTVVQQPYPRTRSKTRIVASSNKGPMLNDYLQATQLQSKNKRHTKTKNKSLEEHVSLPATEDQSIRLKASQRLGNKQATLNSQQEEHAVSSESADVDLSNVADVSTKRPMLSDSLKATLNNASLPLQSKNKRLTKKKNESLEEQDQSIRLKASQRRENKQARPNSQQEEHAVSSESANIDLSIVANVSTKRKCTFEDREDEGFSKSGKLKTRRMQSKEKMKESNDRLESYDSPPSEEILGDKLDVSVQSTSNNLTKRNSSKGKRLTNSRNKQSTKKQKDSLEQVSLPAVEDQNIKLKTRRAQFNSRQDEHPSEERLGAAGTSAVPSQSKRKLRNNSRKKLRKVENSIVDEKENEHLGTSVQPSDTETSHIHLETANRSRSKKSTRRPRNTSYLREVTVSNILQNEGGVRPQRKRKVAPGLITLEEMASILSRPARRPKGEPLMKRRKRRQTRENSRTSKKRNVQRSAVPVPKPRIEGIFEEEEMAHNNSEYVHQQEIDDQPSTSRGIMHSPTRKSPNWLKPRRPKTSYEEPEFQKPSQSNKKQTTTTSRARRRLNKGNDNLNIANNSEEEHVHQQEIDAQPSTSRGIMHSPTRKSPSWSKTGRPKIPYEEPEFQKPSRGNKKQTTTTSRVSRPLNEGNDNMDIANNSDEGHSVFSIQPGPSREPGSIGGMNNGTFSRVLDRVSNMHRSFPSAPSHTGSELRNERDLDSNNEGPPDDECLKLPFGGNAYTVRFIIRRPPESAFRNLGNLHVCEMMKHPNTSYSTGFLKLGVDDLKRPSTGAKYSFVFYVVSGSGQILVNGKRQRVHNGDSFTVPMGISEISVYRIIKEYSSTSTVVVKKEYSRQRKVLDSVDEDTKRIVRGKVHNFFKKNEPPTVEKILKAVNDDARCPNFTHSTFYRLLKELNFW